MVEKNKVIHWLGGEKVLVIVVRSGGEKISRCPSSWLGVKKWIRRILWREAKISGCSYPCLRGAKLECGGLYGGERKIQSLGRR